MPPPSRCALVVIAALLPAAAAAQPAPLELPRSFVAPNFDRVFVGVAEAHEAGAYLARTRGPAAAWYGAAGLATLERSAASVNVRGIELGAVSVGEPFPGTVVADLGTLPLFLSVVLGPDILPWRDVRVAFSGTQQTSWRSRVSWATSDADGHRAYFADATLTSYVGAASVAWSASDRLRLGASLGLVWTTLFENDRLSALTTAGDAHGTIRTRLIDGLVYHLVPSVAFQWDPAEWLAVGAVVRAPGLRLRGGATVHGERQDTTATSSTDTWHHDGDAAFDFRYPLELQAGVALRQRAWELELDARFHASSGTYPLVDSNVPVQSVALPPGGAPEQTPFAPVPFQGRAVVDLSLGGSWAMTDTVRLHGGVYAAPSPVAPTAGLFRHTDLYGARAGVSFQGESLSGSVGLGYETGRSSGSPTVEAIGATPVDGRVRVHHLALTLAAEYRR